MLSKRCRKAQKMQKDAERRRKAQKGATGAERRNRRRKVQKGAERHKKGAERAQKAQMLIVRLFLHSIRGRPPGLQFKDC